MDTRTQAKWDKAARTFDLMAGRGAERRWRPFKEELFANMRGRVLFLALGTGLDIEAFPPGRNITAIDISPKMLEQAAPRIDAYNNACNIVGNNVSNNVNNNASNDVNNNVNSNAGSVGGNVGSNAGNNTGSNVGSNTGNNVTENIGNNSHSSSLNNSHNKVGIDARVMDVHDLAFEDNSFDQVFTSCTFCSVPNPVAGLKSLRRVLRPGGDLMMFEHTGSRYYPFRLMMKAMSRLSEKVGPSMSRETVANVRAAGFELREVDNLFIDVVKIIRAVKPAQ